MEANHLVDYSSFDETIDVEGFLSDKNLTLPKLFALLRTWNQSVQNHFPQLILAVGRRMQKEESRIVGLFSYWTRRLMSMNMI